MKKQFKKLTALLLAVILAVGTFATGILVNETTVKADFNFDEEEPKAFFEFGELYNSWVAKLSDGGYEKTANIMKVAGNAASIAKAGFEATEAIHSILLITGIIQDPTEVKLRSIELQLDSISTQISDMQASIEKVDQSVKQLYTQQAITDRLNAANNNLKAWTSFVAAYITPLEKAYDEFLVKINLANADWYESTAKKDITVYYRAATASDVDEAKGIKENDPIATVYNQDKIDKANSKLQEGQAPIKDVDIYGNSLMTGYTFTIPAAYINASFPNATKYDVDTFNANLHTYLTNSIISAANAGVYNNKGFFYNWNSLSDEQKKAKAASLAADASQAVQNDITYNYFYNCTDSAFIKEVQGSINAFCKALTDIDSVPAVQYLNYLYSNYAFQSEAEKSIEKFELMLDGLLVKYSLMACSVVDYSRFVSSQGKNEMKSNINAAGAYLSDTFSKALQYTSDYCYVTHGNLKYEKDRVSMQSAMKYKVSGKGLALITDDRYLTYVGMDNVSVKQDMSIISTGDKAADKPLVSDTELTILNMLYQKYVARYNAQQEILNSPGYVAGTLPEDEILKRIDSFKDYLKENNVITISSANDNVVYKMNSAQTYDPNSKLKMYDVLSYLGVYGSTNKLRRLSGMSIATKSYAHDKFDSSWLVTSDNHDDGNYYTASNVKDKKRIVASTYNLKNGSIESDKTVLAMQIGENHSHNWTSDEMAIYVIGDDYSYNVDTDRKNVTKVDVTSYYDYAYIYKSAPEKQPVANGGEFEAIDPLEYFANAYAIPEEEAEEPEVIKWDYNTWEEYGKSIDDLVEYNNEHEKVVEAINAHIELAIDKAKEAGLNVSLTEAERNKIFNEMLNQYSKVETQVYISDSLRVTDTLGIYGNEEKTRSLIDELCKDSSIPTENAMSFNLYEPYVGLEFVEKDGKLDYNITDYFNVEPQLFVKDSNSDFVSFYEISDEILAKCDLTVDVYLPLEDNEGANNCVVKHFDDEYFPGLLEEYKVAVESNGDERYAKVTVNQCSPFTVTPLANTTVPTGDNTPVLFYWITLLAAAGALIITVIVGKRKNMRGNR